VPGPPRSLAILDAAVRPRNIQIAALTPTHRSLGTGRR